MQDLIRYIMLGVTLSAVSTGLYAQRPLRPAADSARVARIINDCEDRTDQFKKTLGRALNNSRLDGSAREARLRDDASRLENALDRVGDAYNRDKDMQKTRVAVRQALEAATDINTTMGNRKMGPECEREWNVVHTELNKLAAAFRLKPLPPLRW